MQLLPNPNCRRLHPKEKGSGERRRSFRTSKDPQSRMYSSTSTQKFRDNALVLDLREKKFGIQIPQAIRTSADHMDEERLSADLSRVNLLRPICARSCAFDDSVISGRPANNIFALHVESRVLECVCKVQGKNGRDR